MVRNYKRKKAPPAYSLEDLSRAVQAVNSKTLTYREAQERYGVPAAVIFHQIKGRHTPITTMGAAHPTTLSKETETQIAICLKARAAGGYPVNREELLLLVQNYLTVNNIPNNFKNSKPGEDWFLNFMKRNNTLVLKKPENLQKSRVNACDPFVVYDFYEKLEDVVKTLELQDCPQFVFNADESGFSSDPSKICGIGEKGIPLNRTSGGSGRETTTVLACVSAAGSFLPPLIVFKGLSVQPRWISNECYPGTLHSASKNGWMEEEQFHEWFLKGFINFVNQVREESGKPNQGAILTLDGHKSHMSLRLLQAAIDNNITVLKYPSHLTHIIQPLDKTVFGPLKTAWNKILVKHGKDKMGKAHLNLTKNEFSMLLGKLWQSMSTSNIISGFRATGCFPVDSKMFPRDHFPQPQLAKYEAYLQLQAVNEDVPAEACTVTIPISVEQSLSCDMTLPSTSTQAVSSEAMLHYEENHEKVPESQPASHDTTEKSFEDLIFATANSPPASGPSKKSIRLKHHTYEVLTSEEVLTHIAEAETRRNKRKSSHSTRKNVDTPRQPRKKKPVPVSPESSEDSLTETQDQYDSDSIDITEDIAEVNYTAPNPSNVIPGSFVLVNFKGGRRQATTYKYVCVVETIDEEDGDIVVTGMRCQNEQRTQFNVQLQDKSTIDLTQIAAVLPQPNHKTIGRNFIYEFPGCVTVWEKD